jgi:hypothetical protein
MDVSSSINRVREALEQLGTDCPMEEVAGLCPELTWNQVFLAIDYLSRTGQVRVTLDADRTYRVAAYHAATSEASCVSLGI